TVVEHPVSAGAVGDPDTVAGVGPLVAGVDDLVALDQVVAGLGDPDAVAPDGGVATPRDVRVANDIVVGAGGDLDGLAGDVRAQPVVRVVAADRVRVERPVERHGVRHGEAERVGLDPFARGVVRLGGDRVLAVRDTGRAPPDVVRSLCLDPFLRVAVDSEIHADEPRLRHDVGGQPHDAGHRG